MNDKVARTIFVSFVLEDQDFGADLVVKLRERLPSIPIRACLASSADCFWQTVALPEPPGEHIGVVVLSPAYLSSKAAQQELDIATRRALQGRLRLIPVTRVACQPPGLVGLLESADFTEIAEFGEALDRLVSAIDAENAKPAEPGVIRTEVKVRELTANVLHLIDKGTLPRRLIRGDLSPHKFGTIFLSYAIVDRRFIISLTNFLIKHFPNIDLRDRMLEASPPAFHETVARDFSQSDIFLAVISPEYLDSSALQNELVEATRLALCGQGRIIPILRRSCDPGGLIGMLEHADFTDATKDLSSMQSLIGALVGSSGQRLPPGEVRSGLTIREIGRAAFEIKQSTWKGNYMEEELHFKDLSSRERASIYKDVAEEIEATVADIHAGTYDQDLEDAGLMNAKELFPSNSPWSIPSKQQMSGLEVVLVTLVAKEGLKFSDRVLSDLWTKIVFPRIKQRWGAHVSKT